MALRLLLYAQVLLGAARFAGLLRNERVWELHGTLGLLIAALALLALRPQEGSPAGPPRRWVRFVPLLPLASGLLTRTPLGGLGLTLLHMLLGLVTVGLVEMEAARLHRRKSPGPS